MVRWIVRGVRSVGLMRIGRGILGGRFGVDWIRRTRWSWARPNDRINVRYPDSGFDFTASLTLDRRTTSRDARRAVFRGMPRILLKT